MNGNGHSDEFSNGNEEHVGHWRKGDPCYRMSKSLAELCLFPSVLWKVELVKDTVGYLAEELSKQRVEEMAWFLLMACSKM